MFHRKNPTASNIEETSVVIIGAGVAGLTRATFLQKTGISCVVLERHGRSYIEVRQRAGVVEARGVQMFDRWGLADKLLGGLVAHTADYRINGSTENAISSGAPMTGFCIGLAGHLR